jgi:hypothetical protein
MATDLGIESRQGISRAASRARETWRINSAVGKSSRVPDAVVRFHVPCSECHPGLCRSRHRSVYHIALELAESIRDVVPFSKEVWDRETDGRHDGTRQLVSSFG